jgi:hypothetical protein
MIKYLFSILFSPKQKLKEWHNRYNEKDYEQSMILFVTVCLLLVGSELIYNLISTKENIGYSNLLFTYIELFLSGFLIHVTMWVFGKNREHFLPKLKWIHVYLLTNGILLVITNFFYALLRDDYLGTYLVLTFFLQIISAIYLMMGISVCNETIISFPKNKSKVPVVLRYLVILVVCKFFASGFSGRYFI